MQDNAGYSTRLLTRPPSARPVQRRTAMPHSHVPQQCLSASRMASGKLPDGDEAVHVLCVPAECVLLVAVALHADQGVLLRIARHVSVTVAPRHLPPCRNLVRTIQLPASCASAGAPS